MAHSLSVPVTWPCSLALVEHLGVLLLPSPTVRQVTITNRNSILLKSRPNCLRTALYPKRQAHGRTGKCARVDPTIATQHLKKEQQIFLRGDPAASPTIHPKVFCIMTCSRKENLSGCSAVTEAQRTLSTGDAGSSRRPAPS